MCVCSCVRAFVLARVFVFVRACLHACVRMRVLCQCFECSCLKKKTFSCACDLKAAPLWTGGKAAGQRAVFVPVCVSALRMFMLTETQ